MKIVSFEKAVSYILDGDIILIGGSGGGHAVPEALIVALENRFLAEGYPHGLTLLHPVGIGDNIDQGVSHLAHPGLVRQIVTGALVNSPAFQKRAAQNTVEAYTITAGRSITIDPGDGRRTTRTVVPCWIAYLYRPSFWRRPTE